MKVRVEHGGECRTYAMLRHVAWHQLDFAKTYEEGSLLQLQASAVFCAFAFEAYLNRVGEEEIAFWGEIERISYRKKLTVLTRQLEFEMEPGHPPFQTIWELFNLRDRLAHGRTIEINGVFETSVCPSHDSACYVLPWETLTEEIVQRYFDDLTAAVEMINKARPTPDELLWNQGGRSKTVTAIEPK